MNGISKLTKIISARKTKKIISNLLILLLAILVLSNCATAPVSTEEAVTPAAKSSDGVTTDKVAKLAQEPVAPAADPLAGVYRNKALNYEKAEEFLKAIEMWKIVSSLSPADREIIKKIDDLQRQADTTAESHFNRGVTHYQKGAASSARKEFLLTLLYNPDHRDALDYLKNKLAGEDYVQYVVKKGDTPPSIAQKFYNDPQKDFLISYFNDFDKQTKLIADMNIKIPVLEISEPEQTSEDYDPTIEEAEEPPVKTVEVDIAGLLAKGTALLNAKKYREALSAAESVLKYESTNSAALNMVNVTNYEMGKIASAAKNYNEALKYFSRVNPGYRDVKNVMITTQNLLAEVYYNTGVKSYVNDKIEQAIREWNEALSLNPKQPRARKDIENAQNLLKKLQKLK
jgi:tetratricopeptide (TPR) repeat protein